MHAVEELFGERQDEARGKMGSDGGRLSLSCALECQSRSSSGESSCLGLRTTDLHTNPAVGGLTRSDRTAQPSKLRVIEGVTHVLGGVT